MARVVGVDIGGTKIAAGCLDESGSPVLLGTAPTTPFDGKANAETVHRLIGDELLANARGLGVSIATTFDEQGLLRDPHGWFGWQGQSLDAVFSTAERPAFVEADSVAGAVGEYLMGAGRNQQHLLYVTVGTGVAHCFVLHGKPLVGAHNAAYLSGYTPQAACPWPACDFEHVESIASGPGIAWAYAGDGARDARPVIAAAESGDARAADIVEHAAWHLGALLATMIPMYDPSLVIIGGGLGTGAHSYRTRAIEYAHQLVTKKHVDPVPIVPAALGSESCWVGAIGVAAYRNSLEESMPM